MFLKGSFLCLPCPTYSSLAGDKHAAPLPSPFQYFIDLIVACMLFPPPFIFPPFSLLANSKVTLQDVVPTNVLYALDPPVRTSQFFFLSPPFIFCADFFVNRLGNGSSLFFFSWKILSCFWLSPPFFPFFGMFFPDLFFFFCLSSPPFFFLSDEFASQFHGKTDSYIFLVVG